LKTLHQSVERHGKSKDHTYAALKLKLFGKQNIENSLDSAHRTFILDYNEKVKSNREILKRLIDMTIFLANSWLSEVTMKKKTRQIAVIIGNSRNSCLLMIQNLKNF
jgi:hypothetical protein